MFLFRKLGDGLFLNCCKEVSKDFPNIEFNDMIIDNASMQVSQALLYHSLPNKCTVCITFHVSIPIFENSVDPGQLASDEAS